MAEIVLIRDFGHYKKYENVQGVWYEKCFLY